VIVRLLDDAGLDAEVFVFGPVRGWSVVLDGSRRPWAVLVWDDYVRGWVLTADGTEFSAALRLLVEGDVDQLRVLWDRCAT
jgi:hypothetical protein